MQTAIEKNNDVGNAIPINSILSVFPQCTGLKSKFIKENAAYHSRNHSTPAITNTDKSLIKLACFCMLSIIVLCGF